MKQTSIRILSVSILSAALAAGSAYAGYNGKGGVDDGSAITASELTLNGYQFPNELVANASQTQLANHAWRLFIAANQPTTATLQSGAGRTKPDATRNFNDTDGYQPQANPTVWQSFYHRAEAFPYYKADGTKPNSPANQTPTYYYYLGESNNNRTATQKVITGANYVNLDENNQVSQNMLYYSHGNDPDFPVLFMAKVNDVELNYVWDINAPRFAPSSLEFPHPVVTGDQASTVSTIEVKSAWRRVSDMKNVDPTKFHQVEATYYMGNAEDYAPVTDKFALIALHIIQKTNNYQTFIFTTFEHVDAVVTSEGKIIDPEIDLSYTTLAYGDDSPAQTNAYGAYSVNASGQSGAANVRTDYTLPAAGAADDSRFPVKRLKTISAEVNDVNNQVAALMPADSVWRNYRLKGVQAVPTSYPDNNGTVPLDYYLANIVVESSQPGLQLFTGTVVNPNESNQETFTNNRALPGNDKGAAGPNVSPAPQNNTIGAAKWTMGGCMGCHGNAQVAGQDMSFLGFGIGGNGFFVDPVASSDLTQKEREAYYDDLMNRKATSLQQSMK
ncbi:hypothetical protein [Planctobacterium marinum]|uniref:hypothetical protein n=1 Tax=Planctobacterium marinum TaxID=1631968 RepID=UPI001E56DFC6|nr:hypothetical protein [Planctobacterium marinum]MCC2605084.1 hypothetical protein [Planctobacterium marinum]